MIEVAGTLSIPCGMVVVLVVVDIVVTSSLLPDATALVLASDGFIPIGDIAAWTNTLLPVITEEVFASTCGTLCPAGAITTFCPWAVCAIFAFPKTEIAVPDN